MSINKIFLLLTIALAFILRFYKVEQVPPSLYWDEAAMAVDAKAVVETGHDQHGHFWLQAIYPSWGDYKLPGYILTAVPFFMLFPGKPELAVRLPSVVSGTLLVLVVYELVKELFFPLSITPGVKNQKTPGVEELAGKTHPVFSLATTTPGVFLGAAVIPILAAFLIAILPINFHFSRAAFEGNLALTLNFAFLLFFLKSRRSFAWIVPALLCLAGGFFTYYSARYFLPGIITIAFLTIFPRNRKSILLGLATLAVLGAFWMIYRSDNRAASADRFRLSTKSVLNNTEAIDQSIFLIEDSRNPFRKILYHRYLFLGRDFALHISQHIDFSFLINQYDPNPRHSTGRTGALFYALVPFFLIGCYQLGKRYPQLLIFLAGGYLLAVLPAAATYETPHALRSLNLTPFLAIITAFGLDTLIRQKPKYYQSFWVGIVLIGVLQWGGYLHDYFVHYSARSFRDWQYGYKEAVAAVSADYDQADHVYIDNLYGRAYIYWLLYGKDTIANFQSLRRAILEVRPGDYEETTVWDKITFGHPPDHINYSEKVAAVIPAGSDFSWGRAVPIAGKDGGVLMYYVKNF